LNGLLVVSKTRPQQLSPESLAAPHSADALGLAYVQLLSMGNFVHLPPTAGAVKSTAIKNPGKSRSLKSKP
jgi:hypothetical protein